MIEPIQSIKNLIQDTLPKLRVEYLPIPSTGRLLLIEKLPCMLPCSIPFFLSIYLSRVLFEGLPPATEENYSGSLLFLHRRGLTNTRIENFPELAGQLISDGLELITAENKSLKSLLARMRQAALIVTEAGSCHLNSLIMARRDAIIVNLLPSECIRYPTKSMIISGWPYIFTHPGVVAFPSADESAEVGCNPMVNRKCTYESQRLSRLIKSLTLHSHASPNK